MKLPVLLEIYTIWIENSMKIVWLFKKGEGQVCTIIYHDYDHKLGQWMQVSSLTLFVFISWSWNVLTTQTDHTEKQQSSAGDFFFIVHKISTAILGHILNKALQKALLSLHKSNSLIICISLIMCQESWQSVVRMWLQVQPL